MSRKKARTVDHAVTIPVTEHVPPGLIVRFKVLGGDINGSPFELYASIAGAHLILEVEGRQFVLRGSEAVQAIYSQAIKGATAR